MLQRPQRPPRPPRFASSWIAALVLSLPHAASAVTLHVPTEYPTIGAALAVAVRMDTVLVACGTYEEHDLVLGSEVTMCSETGDPACVRIDALGAGRVFSCVGKLSVVLEGLTIAGGQGLPGLASGGGGLHCTSSGIRLTRCTFVENTAPFGGGLAAYDSDVLLEDCRFERNDADAEVWAAGGGVFCKNSSPVLMHCSFVANTALSQVLPGDGGGIFCDASTLEANDCSFRQNRSGAGGGAMYSYNGDQSVLVRCTFTRNESISGGGMYLETSYAHITDCSFVENVAETGGAILMGQWSAPIVTGTTFSENRAIPHSGGALTCWHSAPLLVECRFLNNHADLDGGAIHCAAVSSPTLERCVLAGNTADSRGGAIRASLAWRVDVTSCTLVENAAGTGSAVYTESSGPVDVVSSILVFAPTGEPVVCADEGEVTLTCSDVYGNAEGDWVGCIASQLAAAGNFSQDPVFCDRAGGDYALKAVSPCAPENSGTCGLVGALEVDCGAVSTDAGLESTSWGRIKAIYR